MVLEVLKNQVNLPILGGTSIAVVLVAGGLIYLLSRRKKSISLKV